MDEQHCASEASDTDDEFNNPTTNSGEAPILFTVVSDSALMREGLVTLIPAYIHVKMVSCYPGVPVADCAPAPTNPPGHVILLDSGIGRETVVAWIRYWHELDSSFYIIVLEMENNIDAILTCIEAGASGYVLIGATAINVAETILGVLDGVAHCSPEVTASLFARLVEKRAQSVQEVASGRLTGRELEVLSLIADGCSNQEIAKILVLELSTVKHHVHNILEKLKLRHRWDAARFAVSQGWLSKHSESDTHNNRALKS